MKGVKMGAKLARAGGLRHQEQLGVIFAMNSFDSKQR